MSFVDDPLHLGDEPDEIIGEIEPDGAPEDGEPAGDGDTNEQPEETAGATDGDGSETSGRQGEVRQPSRRDRRLEATLKIAREANERAERAERLVAERTAQPQESPQARAERLAMMDPDDRVAYLLNEQQQRTDQRLAQIEFRATDSADRTAFEGMCARNPVAAKLKDQVEERLAELRRTNLTAPRETVLKYLLGERALANAGRANGNANRRADENRTRQTARPGSPRSDTSGGRTGGVSEQEARFKRLEDQII